MMDRWKCEALDEFQSLWWVVYYGALHKSERARVSEFPDQNFRASFWYRKKIMSGWNLLGQYCESPLEVPLKNGNTFGKEAKYRHTPPRKRLWVYYQPMSFSCKFWKRTLLKPLVKRSPSWLLELIFINWMFCGPICSRNQWYFMA